MFYVEEYWRKRRLRGPTHCQWCEHWGGPEKLNDPDGSTWCLLDKRSISTPAHGCCCWARATGLDRDDIPPKMPYVDAFAERLAAMTPDEYEAWKVEHNKRFPLPPPARFPPRVG